MPNIDNDNVLAALCLYQKRIAVLKKQTASTVAKTAAEELTQLEGELQLSVIACEVSEIVKCLNVLNHLLENK